MKKQIEHIFGQIGRDIAALKKMTFKKKCQFLWDYYKIPILVLLFALVILIMAVSIRSTKKNSLLYVVYINGIAPEESTYFDDLMVNAGYELKNKTVNVDTGMTLGTEGNESADAQTMQVLAALFGIGDLDIFIADREHFDLYGAKDAFADLSLLIDSELLEAAGDRIYYYENSDGETIAGGYIVKDDGSMAAAGYLQSGDEVVIGALNQAQNLDEAVDLISEMIREDCVK